MSLAVASVCTSFRSRSFPSMKVVPHRQIEHLVPLEGVQRQLAGAALGLLGHELLCLGPGPAAALGAAEPFLLLCGRWVTVSDDGDLPEFPESFDCSRRSRSTSAANTAISLVPGDQLSLESAIRSASSTRASKYRARLVVDTHAPRDQW